MMSARRPSDPSRPEDPARSTPLADDVLVIGRLVLELVHAGYAADDSGHGRSRSGVAAAARAAGDAHAAETPRVSRQAVRASVELYQRGELTMSELAASLGMSPGWATRVVDELVTAGLAERTPEPRDRRIVRVRLAPAARELAAAAYSWHGEAIERALAGLGGDERAAVRAFLARAVEELSRGEE